MVHACIINGCSSVSGKNLGLFYYRLPKDEILRSRWMNMITPKQGLVLNDNSLICSKHFKEMDYVNYAKRILRKNAVPTMFPLLDNEQADTTVDEIKTEQSSTDCESDVEMVPDEQVETIKVEETETSNYNEDSTIRVVDVESILKNQVETSSLENETVATNAQPQQHTNLNQTEDQSLREAFKNFTGNTNSLETQVNAPGSVPTTVVNNNHSLQNFIYVSQQQQQSPNSLLIELLPLSFPQTSQAPLAVKPIQRNGMLVRPVYVTDKKDKSIQRLVGTEIINPQTLHAGIQNQQKQIVGLQKIQPIVLPQNVQPIVKQQKVEEQNDQKFITMKSEVSEEQNADIQTVEPKIKRRDIITYSGPKGLKRKPKQMIRNVSVSPKKIKAKPKVVAPINKNQNAFAKLKGNYESLQRKYDEVRAILDLLKEKKLNVEHIDDFYTTKPKRNTQNENDSVSCGVWWRGSGFVGTRPN